MNRILEKINLKEQKHLVFIAIIIFATLFFGKKIWENQKVKTARIKDKIKSYQKAIELAGQITASKERLGKFKELSWPSKESVAIMGSINELASNYGIEIFSFDPGGLRDIGQYFILSFSLNIRTDFFNLTRFVSAIEELTTLTKVTYLRIVPEGSSSEEGGPRATVNISIETYIYKE